MLLFNLELKQYIVDQMSLMEINLNKRWKESRDLWPPPSSYLEMLWDMIPVNWEVSFTFMDSGSLSLPPASSMN